MGETKPIFEVDLNFRGYTRRVKLTDVSADPSWCPVLAVEEWRDPIGQVTSVFNHRDRTFAERAAELAPKPTESVIEGGQQG